MSYVNSVGIATDIAARNRGAALGVWNLFYNSHLLSTEIHWQDIIFHKSSKSGIDALQDIIEINKKAANATCKTFSMDEQCVFFSGDHSGAIGTWSGVSAALESDIGMIWVDAHLDSHTPETSMSKNIHGMPVAHLLGFGEKELCRILTDKPKIKPENICFLGARSYESAEMRLIKKLGCKVYTTEDILNANIKELMKDAVKHVSKNTIGFGISLDIDVFDPREAPGTGYPEKNGLFLSHFNYFFEAIHSNKKFLCMEISEYNTILDQNDKTFRLIDEILKNIYN